jgi:hypothetical protein
VALAVTAVLGLTTRMVEEAGADEAEDLEGEAAVVADTTGVFVDELGLAVELEVRTESVWEVVAKVCALLETEVIDDATALLEVTEDAADVAAFVVLEGAAAFVVLEDGAAFVELDVDNTVTLEVFDRTTLVVCEAMTLEVLDFVGTTALNEVPVTFLLTVEEAVTEDTAVLLELTGAELDGATYVVFPTRAAL